MVLSDSGLIVDDSRYAISATRTRNQRTNRLEALTEPGILSSQLQKSYALYPPPLPLWLLQYTTTPLHHHRLPPPLQFYIFSLPTI